MKIEIETNLLCAALRVVAVAAASRPTLPILSHVKLSAKAGRLELTATNLDLFVSESVVAETIEDGETTAPLGLLSQLCGRIQSSMIELRVFGATLAVKGGDISAEVATLPAEEFPPTSRTDGQRTGCDASELITPFQKLAQAMMVVDPSRYNLMGVNIAPAKPGTTFVSTNGNKLALFSTETRLTDTDVIVPDMFVRALLKIDPKGLGTLSVSGDSVKFASNGTTISSKLIEGRFPNWKQVVPEAGSHMFSCGRKDLIDAISTCALLTSPELPGVTMTGKGKQIEIKRHSENANAKAMVMGSELAGQPDMAIAFNARSMLDTLNVMEGDDLRIACVNEGDPMLIQEGQFKAVIMPIRVNA